MDRRWDKSKPPRGPFTLNRDCPQAAGLVAWWPMGNITGRTFIADEVNKAEMWQGTTPGAITLGPDGAPMLSFTAASSQYRYGVAPISAMPLSMSAWFVADSSTQTLFYIGDALSTNANFCRMVLVSGKVRANIAEATGGTQQNAITTASYTAGALQHASATFASSTSRTVYLNGGNAVTDTTACAPSAFARVQIGAVMNNGPVLAQFMNGLIGECALWNVALPADIHARLADPGTRFELWYPLRSKKWFIGPTSYTLTAESGTYTLTGQAAGLLTTRTLPAEQGSYTLTGQDAGLYVGRVVTAEQGSYTLNGQDATLTYTPAGAYSLTAGQGSYTLTGQDVTLLATRALQAEQGTYTITGQAADLLRGLALSAEAGTYTLTGQDAAFSRTYALAAAYGAYALTGQAVTLTYSGGTLPAYTETLRAASRITRLRAASRITTLRFTD